MPLTGLSSALNVGVARAPPPLPLPEAAGAKEAGRTTLPAPIVTNPAVAAVCAVVVAAVDVAAGTGCVDVDAAAADGRGGAAVRMPATIVVAAAWNVGGGS